jgi:ankyrin repeat protein
MFISVPLDKLMRFLSESRQTPLHVAVDNNRADVAELLIVNGASVSVVTQPNMDTPLHLAKSIELATVLFESGASLEAQNAWLQTPLHCACKSGHEELVQYLIRCGANMNAKDQQGRTSLHYCAAGNKEAVAQFLVEAGCSVGEQDTEGVSALALAELMAFQGVARVISAHQRLSSQQSVFSAEK